MRLTTSDRPLRRGMAAQPLVRPEARTRTDRLADASEQLEDVLQSVDLADEPALADAVVDAVEATARAQRLAIGR